DVLLRYQVQAIAEGCDPGDVCGNIKANQLGTVERAVKMQDRLPFQPTEAPVDATHGLLDLAPHGLELLHPGAGRHRDLDEGNVAVPFRMPLEVALEAFEPLQHALHVIEPLGRDDDRVCAGPLPDLLRRML